MALSNDERIKVFHAGEWRAGVVRFEWHWQSFYFELPGTTLWMADWRAGLMVIPPGIEYNAIPYWESLIS